MAAGGPDEGATGWFGKLSTIGDFAARRVPEAARARLDAWLSQVLDGSREQLGEAWLERYLGAPLQRFVLGPGVVDGLWWFGVLMPSCDNVGRYFPLVVLHARAAPPLDAPGLDHLERWWHAAAEALLETLSDSVDVARFEAAVAALPAWPTAELPAQWVAGAVGAAAAGDDETLELQVPAACAAADVVQGLAAAAWLHRLAGRSLWWSWRPQGGEARCRIVGGLPSAQAFAAMLVEDA